MNKENKKYIVGLVCAFIIGLLISGGVVKALGELLASNIVYDNTQSGLSATNAQAALDELYSKAQNMVPIDPDTFTTNTAKTVYASSKGVCIKRNNKLNCFKPNNFEEEQNHIQQVFSDASCDVDSSYVNCSASDFNCCVFSNGDMNCGDLSVYSYCSVNADGSVSCS